MHVTLPSLAAERLNFFAKILGRRPQGLPDYTDRSANTTRFALTFANSGP